MAAVEVTQHSNRVLRCGQMLNRSAVGCAAGRKVRSAAVNATRAGLTLSEIADSVSGIASAERAAAPRRRRRALQ
jgi:N-acetylglucosamine kinase-like BadF-type ATPase